MGMTRVEGVFKRGCEETLQVLRDEQDILFTLLDVFRHDPLHSWTISPLKRKKVQRDENSESDEQNMVDKDGTEEADVALFGVRKKMSSALSVQCQVQELINEAMDPRNLCRMFPGWQAWI